MTKTGKISNDKTHKTITKAITPLAIQRLVTYLTLNFLIAKQMEKYK